MTDNEKSKIASTAASWIPQGRPRRR